MATRQLVRVFKYAGKDLVDVNPSYTPERILEVYSNQYEGLVNAKVKGPKIEDNKAVYTFSSSLGTKG